MIERNALAELSERLGEITSAWRPAEPTGQYATQSISYVRKAQRIVTELAKAENPIDLRTVGMTHLADILEADKNRAVEIVRNCRAIAEEGKTE